MALALLAMPALACQLLLGIGDDSFTYVAPDAAAEVQVEPPVLPDPCAHVVPPAKPLGDFTEGDRQLIFAVRHANITGRTPAGAITGYDLDNTCTCDSRPGAANGGRRSCTPPATSPRPDLCDEADGGVDNTGVYLFDQLGVLPGLGGPTGLLAHSYDNQTRCGHEALLLVVRNYNGQKNDPSVVVFGLESGGVRQPYDDGAGPPEDSGCAPFDTSDPGAAYPPRFDGTDRWSTAPGALTAGADPIPNRSSAIGWVRDFELVVDGRDPKNPISLPIVFGPKVFTVTTGVLHARLVPVDGNGRELGIDPSGRIMSEDGGAAAFKLTDGVLTGRATAKDLLAAIGEFPLGADGQLGSLCAQPQLFGLFKSAVCEAVDTVSIPSNDFVPERCDALSIVVQFDAVQARYGVIYTAPPRIARCDGGEQTTCPP